MQSLRPLPLCVAGFLLFFIKIPPAQAQESLTGQPQPVIDSLWEVGIAAYSRGDLDEMQRLMVVLDSEYRRRLPLDSLSIANVWRMRATYHVARYELGEAARLMDSTVHWMPDTPEGRSGRTMAQLAKLNYSDALRVDNSFHLVKRIGRQLLDDTIQTNVDIAGAYGAIAAKCLDLGFYREGLVYLEQARQRYAAATPEEITSTPVRTPYYLNYVGANLARRLGDDETADRYVRRLEDLYAKGDATPQETQFLILVYRGAISAYFANNVPDSEAEVTVVRRLIDRARALDGGALNADLQQSLNYYQVIIDRYAGRYAEAERLVDALIAAPGINGKSQHSNFYEKAMIALATDRPALAFSSIDSVIANIHVGNAPLTADYSNYQPNVVRAIKPMIANFVEALLDKYGDRYLERAEQLNELALAGVLRNMRQLPTSPLFRRGYDPVLRNLIRLDSLRGNTGIYSARALAMLESFEGRTAWRAFLNSRKAIQLPTADSLSAVESILYAELAKARREGETSEAFFRAAQALEDYQTRRAERYPGYFSSNDPVLDVEALVAETPGGTLILRYVYLEGQLYRFRVDRDGVRATALLTTPISSDAIAALNDPLAIPAAQLARLAEYLLPSDLSTYSHLVIVPAGPLFRLPFELLAPDGRPLVESHVLTYRTTLFAQPPRPAVTRSPLLAVAPTYAQPAPPAALALRDGTVALEGAAAESAYLVDLFGGRMVTDATTAKSAFVNEAPDARLLHLAMHARIDNEQPELSYFDFGGDDQESSRLYVEELYGLNLGADLAVLSACNTGRGKIDDTKGLVSLHRAFTYAGVPATVASLWAVPDAATATLMKSFYERLHAGEPKDVALRGAKLDYLATTTEPALRAPLYWAGFVLYGDPSPVAGGGAAWWWYLLGVGVVLVGGAWVARRV